VVKPQPSNSPDTDCGYKSNTNKTTHLLFGRQRNTQQGCFRFHRMQHQERNNQPGSCDLSTPLREPCCKTIFHRSIETISRQSISRPSLTAIKAVISYVLCQYKIPLVGDMRTNSKWLHPQVTPCSLCAAALPEIDFERKTVVHRAK
jgi:hypothetical protein